MPNKRRRSFIDVESETPSAGFKLLEAPAQLSPSSSALTAIFARARAFLVPRKRARVDMSSSSSSSESLRPTLKSTASARQVAEEVFPREPSKSAPVDAVRQASSIAASPIASTSANVMQPIIFSHDEENDEREIDALLPPPTQPVTKREQETTSVKRRKAKGKAKAVPVSVQALSALDDDEAETSSLPVEIPRLRNALAPTARSPRFNKGMPPQAQLPLKPSSSTHPAEPDETNDEVFAATKHDAQAKTGEVQAARHEVDAQSLYPALPISFRAARMLEPSASEVDISSPLVGSEAPSSPSTSYSRTAATSPLAPSPGGMRALSLYPKLPTSLRSEHEEEHKSAVEPSSSSTPAKNIAAGRTAEPAATPPTSAGFVPEANHVALQRTAEDADRAPSVPSDARVWPPTVHANGSARSENVFQGFREATKDQNDDQENCLPALSVPAFLSPALASTSPARFVSAGTSDRAPIDFTEDTESGDEAAVAPGLQSSPHQARHRSVLAPIATPRAPRQSTGHLSGFQAPLRSASSRRSSILSLDRAHDGTALQSVAALGASVLGLPGIPYVPCRAPSIRSEPPQPKRRVKRDPMGMKRYRFDLDLHRREKKLELAAKLKRHALATGNYDTKGLDSMLKLHARVERSATAAGARVGQLTDEDYELEALKRIIQRDERRATHNRLRTSRASQKELERLKADEAARLKRARGILGRQPFPNKLDPVQEAEVDAAMRNVNFSKTIKGAGVTNRDLQSLRPYEWLNDEVIGFYAALINSRCTEAMEARQKAAKLNAVEKRKANACWNVHVFITHMYSTIKKSGHDGVKRWTKKIDVFSKDRLLFPVNLAGSHWVCASIDLRARRFEFYDSLAGSRWDLEARKVLALWLEMEWLAKKKEAFGGRKLDTSGWSSHRSQCNPQQRNGYDCGVFASLMIEHLSRRDPWQPMPLPLDLEQLLQDSDRLSKARKESATGSDESESGEEDEEHDDNDSPPDQEWNFSQANIPYMRRRFVYEIINAKLLNS